MASTTNKAKATGIKDGLLTVLFTVLSYAGVELLTYLLTLLPILDTYQAGKYAFLQVPLALIGGAILKGIDRKKHEDPQDPATGIVSL